MTSGWGGVGACLGATEKRLDLAGHTAKIGERVVWEELESCFLCKGRFDAESAFGDGGSEG